VVAITDPLDPLETSASPETVRQPHVIDRPP
jgi:hypothetical protein